MKFNLMVLSFSAALIATSAAHAELKPLPNDVQTQLLVEITNDRDRDVSSMALMIDAQEKVSGLYTETETPRGVDENKIYPLKELQSSKGIVVEEQDGYEVIRLQGKVDDKKGSAQLSIKYLTNGLFGSYKTCKLAATRDANGQWAAYNPSNGRSVRQVHVVTHSMGIKRLEGACD